jgi:hypothetical protein
MQGYICISVLSYVQTLDGPVYKLVAGSCWGFRITSEDPAKTTDLPSMYAVIGSDDWGIQKILTFGPIFSLDDIVFSELFLLATKSFSLLY